jgi:hypothetical protein
MFSVSKRNKLIILKKQTNLQVIRCLVANHLNGLGYLITSNCICVVFRFTDTASSSIVEPVYNAQKKDAMSGAKTKETSGSTRCTVIGKKIGHCLLVAWLSE